MLVLSITFLALAPSSFVNAHFEVLDPVRGADRIGCRGWCSSCSPMLLTDLAQYWFHRLFHRVLFLWGFHAVHFHSAHLARLAGRRADAFRGDRAAAGGVTSLPLLTLGFAPSVMQAYVGMVCVLTPRWCTREPRRQLSTGWGGRCW